MASLFTVIDIFLGFLQFMMILYGIMSLLVFFNILNPYGRVVGMVWHNLNGLFDPILKPLRRVIPPFRGFDWSFLVLYLLTVFLRSLIHEYALTVPSTVVPVA